MRYKFRTMRVGGFELRGEATSVGDSWKIDGDSRVTRLGSVLRHTRLRCMSADEIPQLLNVLLGHMSLWK
jgi:lipopolysaccharide/colanic/teichoic acid biosynthesis glycosyltransferase